MPRTFVWRHTAGAERLIIGNGFAGRTTATAAPSAPVLTNPIDVFVSATSGSGSVDTDVGSGTLYYVLSSSATAPSVAQIKAGNDHTGSAAVASGSQAVSATGTQNTPTITGLTASTTYYLHFVHNANSLDSNVSAGDGFTTPSAGAGSVTISSQSFPTSGGSIPVGAAVHFDTSSISGFDTTDSPASDYNPGRVDLVARWNFDDTGTWDKPGLMVAEHKDRGRAMGHSVCHSWSTPGTKTVSVEVRDASGETGTDSVSVTVVSLTDYIPQANRLVVDPGGTYSGAPTHNGANEFTSINAAVAAAKAISGNVGIWFKTGETYNWTTNTRFEEDWSGTTLTFAAYGGGARPTIKWPGSANGWWIDGTSTLSGILLNGIEMLSDWDAETLSNSGNEDMGVFYPNYPGHLNFYDCKISGYSICLYHGSGNGTTSPRVAVMDSQITNWRNFGVYGEVGQSDVNGGRFSAAGTDFGQNALGAQGLGKGSAIRSPQNLQSEINAHTVRIGDAFVNFRGCYIFGNNGWTEAAGGLGYPAIQPLRINTGGIPGFRGDFWGNTLENGDRIAYAEFAGPDGFNGQITLVMDGNVFLGSAYSYDSCFRSAQSGVAFRNNICVIPNTAYIPGIGSGDDGSKFWVEHIGGTTSPIHVYNNTFVDLRNAANSFDNLIPINNTLPSGSVVANNIQHAPSKDTPYAVDAPLNSTASGATPRFLGLRTGFEIDDTNHGTINNGGSFTVSYPSGYSQADFVGGNAPSQAEAVYVGSNGATYTENVGGCSFSYGASNITVTNSSGATWSGVIRTFINVAATQAVDTSYVTPAASLATFTPTTGSAAIGDAAKTGSDKWALTDIRGTWRASVLSGLSRSVESRGAWEPALES